MASKNKSSTSHQSTKALDNHEDKENGKRKAATSNQPQLVQIGDDNEKPSCSRSLPHRVRFSSNDTNNDGDKWECAEIEIIKESRIPPKSSAEQPPPLTPLPSAIHHRPRDHDEHNNSTDKNDTIAESNNEVEYEFNSEVVSDYHPFSDTVLTLPNLPDFEESKEEHENNNESKPQNDGDEISRKSPKIDFTEHFDLNNNGEESDKDYENEGGNFNGQQVDENNNFILWPKESEKKLIQHASYIFHKDRRGELKRLTKLMPRGREYVVFNIFTDFARLIGIGRKSRKHVAFPEEFLEKYEQQGDVAGKSRFVPATKQPYKGIQVSSVKRRISAVYSLWTVKSSEFVPRVDRIDDANKCDYFCEKYCLSCDCLRSSKSLSGVINVVEGYLSDLNAASLFLHGHATLTFESALRNLEFVKFHQSTTGIVAPSPWTTNYANQHIGVLSGSVWIWAYCIRSIVIQARDKDAKQHVANLPSEESFRKVIEQYATLCLTLSENVKAVLQYNHNFYNFCKECVRIIKAIQVHIGFRCDIRLNKPLKRGGGLVLNRLSKREIAKQNGIDVKVARHESAPPTDTLEPEEVLEWKSFGDLSGKEKSVSLYYLLNVTSEGMSMVQTQLRFLMDDIVDLVKDITEADLLYLLADIYDRVKFLQNIGLKRVKPEVEQISKTMSEFCRDFQSFADYGQHIMKRFVEFRDMVHLTYHFLVHGLKLDSVAEMVPATTFKKKRHIGCCGGGSGGNEPKILKKSINDYHPKYQVLDFFRVYYEDMVRWKAEIDANKYSFCIDKSMQPIGEVLPKGIDQIWGPDATSPRFSFEEYMDNEDLDDDSGGGGGEKDKGDAPKPILVSQVSPRGSLDDGNTNESAKAEGTLASPPKNNERGSTDSNNEGKQNRASK